MKINLARLEHAKLISRFLARVHDQSFPHQELFSEDTVQELIRNDELAVVLASHEKSILGCGLAFLYPWNNSLKIGPVSVGNIERRAKVERALLVAVQRLGKKKYGLAHVGAGDKEAFQRFRKLGATCWGYRPAPGSSRVDDSELMMGFFHSDGEVDRVEPPLNAVTGTAFSSRIIKGFEDSEHGVPHPKNYPVGCPQGTGAPMISGRVWPTYHSQGNYIEIENAAGAYPVEIIKEFKDKVKKKGVRDLRLTLPVNQEEAFFELLDAGFRPVAYLPGWFLRGAYRFDCIKMVAGAPSIPRNPQTFIERAVARVDSEFALD